MIRNKELKIKVRKLRLKGMTYREIMTRLKILVPKSTLSFWCCDIPLPAFYEKKLAKLNHQNLSKAQKMAWLWHKANFDKEMAHIVAINKPLIKKLKDKGVLKMILAFLYLGEGSKWKSHRGLTLGSSDPNIITLYLDLLSRCYGLNSKNLKCRISYRADQNIKLLEKYWSKVTGIPKSNFYKTIPDPRTIGKPTKRSDYKGVCVIIGGSTKFQLELEAIPRIILDAFKGM